MHNDNNNNIRMNKCTVSKCIIMIINILSQLTCVFNSTSSSSSSSSNNNNNNNNNSNIEIDLVSTTFHQFNTQFISYVQPMLDICDHKYIYISYNSYIYLLILNIERNKD